MNIRKESCSQRKIDKHLRRAWQQIDLVLAKLMTSSDMLDIHSDNMICWTFWVWQKEKKKIAFYIRGYSNRCSIRFMHVLKFLRLAGYGPENRLCGLVFTVIWYIYVFWPDKSDYIKRALVYTLLSEAISASTTGDKLVHATNMVYNLGLQ